MSEDIDVEGVLLRLNDGPERDVIIALRHALGVWLRAMHTGRSEPLFIARDHSLRLLNLRSEANA